MMPKILFLTTSHRYYDDRIFYHQAIALRNEGFEVKVCSLSSEYNGDKDGVMIDSFSILEKSTQQKMKVFQGVISRFSPDVIIASEPLAVIAAHRYKSKNCKIIYDITEWYPSMRMLSPYPFGIRLLQGIKFFLIQVYAGWASTGFIFGENTKKFPLAYLFSFKKKIILPYYPDEKYISPEIHQLKKNSITLCYTGVFSKEKGIGNFFEAIEKLKNKRENLEVHILLIGSSRKKEDEAYFQGLLQKYQWKHIEIRKPVSFENFSKSYQEADICFDLREKNFENEHCLPIKIFYYIASGKPVIYTDLKATKLHLQVSEFGFLVTPKDSDRIAEVIFRYIDEPNLYHQHAVNARHQYLTKYTWNSIKQSFTGFVKSFI